MIWMGAGEVLGIPVAGIIAVVIVCWDGSSCGTWRSDVQCLPLAATGRRPECRASTSIGPRSRSISSRASSPPLPASSLAGRLNSSNALMAGEENLRSIAAVVIGGTNLFGGEGGVFGSLIGAFIMGELGNGLNLLNVSAFWQRIVQGLVIILVVVFDQWRRRRLPRL